MNTPRGYYKGMQKKLKNRVIRRLKIVEGQIRGLQHMVVKEEYCIDILHQSFAAKEALSTIENLILQNHLATHAMKQMKSGKAAQAAAEILEIYKLAKKK